MGHHDPIPSDPRNVGHAVPAERSTDEVIADVAGGQEGRVSRAQLERVGVGHGALDDRRDRGALISLYRGFYAVGHASPSRASDLRLATLIGGDGSVVTHLPGLELHRFVGQQNGPIDVTVLKKRRPRDGILWHRDRIEPDECGHIDGIPVSCLVRTLRDSAPLVSRKHLDRLLDRTQDYLRFDPITFAELFLRYPRHPGCRILKAALADRSEGKTRSWLERRFTPVIRGLPKPERNKRIRLKTGRTIEADCGWGRLIAELDGRTYHERQAAFESDRERDATALASGYVTMRITWRRLRDEPEKVRRDLEDAIASLP